MAGTALFYLLDSWVVDVLQIPMTFDRVTHPRATKRPMSVIRNRIARWSRLFFEFALSQGVAQSAGMVSGLIYVRLMPVDQYALYALGLTALSFASVGSDMGLTGSLSYFWRESGKHSSVMAPRIAAVKRLRVAFLGLAILICGVLFLKAAGEQNLSMTSMLACFALVVATAWFDVRATVDLYLMRLQGMQRQSYYCEAAGSISRLLAAVTMALTGITMALFALAGSLLGTISIVVAMLGFGHTVSSNSQPITRETWREVMRYIMPMVPTTIVYILQGPLIFWLAWRFGGQVPLAETFAVGRLSAIYALLGNFIVAVVAPRLAGLVDDAHFARMTAFFLLGLLLLCAGMTIVAYLAPWALLLLIGPKYAHLQTEVILSMVGASFGVLIAFLAIANRLRGWVRLEPIVAACQALATVVLASRWSFRDSASVLELMAVLSCFSFICFFVTSVIGMFAPNAVKIR